MYTTPTSSCVLASPSSMIRSNALTLMPADVVKCITSEWRARSTLCMRRGRVGVARNKVRSDSGVWMWMSYSPSGSVRGTNSRLGSRGTWTHANARWAMKEIVPPESIATSTGWCLEPISALIEAERAAVCDNQRKRRMGRDPPKMGHGPLVVTHPTTTNECLI